MRLRHAGSEDGPMLTEFFRRTPMEAGTAFVFDRGPDFYALLELKGQSRTFLVFDGDRLAGTATALWRSGWDGGSEITVGEVVDLRIVESARGSRAAWQLLGAVREVFNAVGVEWISCLIGSDNRAAATLVRGRAGLPRLEPRARFASVHYLAWRAPTGGPLPWKITQATPTDGPTLAALFEPTRAMSRFSPMEPMPWPDSTARSTAWLAKDRNGCAAGALLLWDGDTVRRIRISRYRASDAPLRLLARAMGSIRAAVPFPTPGGVLRTWASRAFVLADPRPALARALLRAALREAVRSGRHVVQINVEQGSPLLPLLPRYPRSTYWSTLYGAPFGTQHLSILPDQSSDYADIALA